MARRVTVSLSESASLKGNQKCDDAMQASDKKIYIEVTMLVNPDSVTRDGKTYSLEVKSDDSICEVSRKLSERIGMPHPRSRRFFLKPRDSKDNIAVDTCGYPPCKGCRRLSDYGKIDTLYEGLRLRGWPGATQSHMVSVQGSSPSISELLLAILYLRTRSPHLILYSG